MSAAADNPSGEGGFKARAGALSLFFTASDLDRSILHTILAEAATGVRIQDELPEPDDDPLHMSIFEDPYLLEPADPDADPEEPIGPHTQMRATAAGRELIFVAATLERWLGLCPTGALELGERGGPAVAALLTGWASTVIHAVVARPISVYEAADAIPTLPFELVEDRIEALAEAGLLDRDPDDDLEPLYTATDWLRLGIAPLIAGARMELRHPPDDTAPVAIADVVAGFNMVLPLLRLPEDASGSCLLSIELDPEVCDHAVGVTAQLEQGRVVSVEPGLNEDADARATGTIADWLDTVSEPDAKFVRTKGDRLLARRILDGLYEALFGEGP